MKLTLRNIATATLFVVLIGLAYALSINAQHALAGYISNSQPVRAERLVVYDFFASSTPGVAPTTFATTTSATSTQIAQWTDESGRIDNGYFVVAGADKVTMFFSRSAPTGTNGGSSTFKIEVSEDGSNWVPYKKLISNVTNTNAQTVTRAEEFTISAATSTTIATVDPDDSIYAIRCIATEATDGYHRCKAVATFK